MNNEKTKELIERLDFIEFRQELLFNDTDINRTVFEYKITRNQFNDIMDLMDKYQELIDNGEKCSYHDFEEDMYDILPKHKGNYHLCEEIAKDFMIDGRWVDVFNKLYGNMNKYSSIKKSKM